MSQDEKKAKQLQTSRIWIGKRKVKQDISLKEEADRLVEWFLKSVKNVTLSQYTIERGYPRRYLLRWAEQNEYFAEKLERAKDIQEERLLRKGLNCDHDSRLTALALMQYHGWKITRDGDQQGGNKQTVQIVIHKNYPQKESDVSVAQSASDASTGSNAGADRLGLQLKTD